MHQDAFFNVNAFIASLSKNNQKSDEYFITKINCQRIGILCEFSFKMKLVQRYNKSD